MCVCTRQGRPQASQPDRLGRYIFTLTEGSGSEGLLTTTGWLLSETRSCTVSFCVEAVSPRFVLAITLDFRASCLSVSVCVDL